MRCEHLLAKLTPGGCPLCVRPIASPDKVASGGDTIQRNSPLDHIGFADALVKPHGGAPRGLKAVPVDLNSSPEDVPVWLLGLDNEYETPVDPESADLDSAAEVLRVLDQDACRASLSEFIKLAFAVIKPGVELHWGPHIQAMCDHIQWQLEDRARVVADRTRTATLKAQNLLINIPPRSLKTIVLTLATVWMWLRWPTLKILYLSANPRVSSTSARMARDLMHSHWFQTTFQPRWNPMDLNEDGDPIPEPEPLFGIRADQEALSDLGNTLGGTRCARGLASTITGEGCEILLIDDPHDVSDGLAKVAQAVEDYNGAVHGRLNNHRTDLRMCIMQRIRPNDLSAAWIAANDSLCHLRLPMEYESPDSGKVECNCGSCTGANQFGFQDWRSTDGEIIHPWFTPTYLDGERKRLQSRYVGQHQQRPLEAGGQIFKVGWWAWHSLTTSTPCARPEGARSEPAFVIARRRNGSLDLDHLCISVDVTGGSTSADASALGICVFGGKGLRRFLLRDLTQGPRTWLQTLSDLRAAILTAVRIAGHQPRICVLVEKKALGQAAIEQITEYIREGELKYPDGRPIIATVEAYEPTGKGDKTQRAELMEPDIAAGLLSLCDGDEPNTGPYRAEIESFPKAPRNDRVDVTSQYMDHYRGKKNTWVEMFKTRRAEQLAKTAG